MPRLALACLLAAALIIPTTPAPVAAAAVAPGCTASRPTRIGGTIRGSDGRAVNAHIGIQLISATGSVEEDGTPNTSGSYAYIVKFNPDHPPTGLDTGVRTWSTCVHGSVVRAHLETGPKRPGGLTDESRYGSTAHYRQPVTPGATTDVLLRLPVTWQAARGNTGGVHGYVWYGNRRVPPEAITRVRAFTYHSGPECGIEGYSASADQLIAGFGGTYYRVDYLAGGQCGRTAQWYSLQMDCTSFCGAAKRSVNIRVGVTKGRWPRVDVRF